MIGVDTNVLVRFLVDDDAGQSAIARKFMSERSSESPAFLSAVALAETVWLLSKRFEYPRAVVIETIRVLLSADGLLIEHTDDLDSWLNGDEEPRGDLSDHLIAWAGVRVGCRSTVTFDIKAAKSVHGMELLQ
jgi:predicted nucleic-acid-binding protein